MKEKVLVVIKPDGMTKGLAGVVLTRFEETKLHMRDIRLVAPTRKLAEQHYKHLKNKPFYPGVIEYLLGKYHGTSHVLAIVYEGENAVAVSRKLAGATNPEEAHPHTIRGSMGRITTAGVFENVVHVSSDAKEARREIKLWFKTSDG